jgi:hypothetical protein
MGEREIERIACEYFRDIKAMQLMLYEPKLEYDT